MCIADNISHMDSLRISLIPVRKPMTKADFLKLSAFHELTIARTPLICAITGKNYSCSAKILGTISLIFASYARKAADPNVSRVTAQGKLPWCFY